MENPAPDGGWGWMVVLSSFSIHMIVYGITYTFGIFYVELLDHYQESKAATAWVESIMLSTTSVIGPLAGILTDRFGCKAVTILGSILAASGLVMSTLAPNVTFLYFSIGLCTGFGFCLMRLPAIVCVATYFSSKLALATGIAVSGSGIGTTVLAPLVQYLIAQFGWRGAMLILAGLVLNGCVFGCFFRKLETKTPEKRNDTLHFHNSKRMSIWSMVNTRESFSVEMISKYQQENTSTVDLLDNTDEKKRGKFEVLYEMLALLGDPTFVILCVHFFLMALGYDVPHVYIADRAKQLGVADKDQAIYLVTIMGLSNTLIRVVMGYLSDRSWINRLWLYSGCMTACGIATLLSPLCNSYSLMALYVSAYGGTAGTFISLKSVILVDILGLDKLVKAYGILLMLEGVASLIGSPTTGFLFDITGSYDPGFYFAGAMLFLSGLMPFCIPILQNKRVGTESTKL